MTPKPTTAADLHAQALSDLEAGRPLATLKAWQVLIRQDSAAVHRHLQAAAATLPTDPLASIRRQAIQLAHEMGLLNLHIPEAYGGAGLGSIEEVLVNEELAWGDPGFATAAYATALASAPIITGATEEQKEVWLRKIAEEGALASYAVTEPGAGSDVAACKTTAIRGFRRCV